MESRAPRTRIIGKRSVSRWGRGPIKTGLGRGSIYVTLTVSGIISMAPFIWMIFGAFKTGAEMRAVPPTFWPREWTLDNFKTILHDPDLPIGLFYRNSMFVAIANTFLVLFVGSLLGFVFAKYEFRGRTPLFWFILATMMIPRQVLMIPSFLILAKVGLINSLLGLVIPAAIDAFAIFLMRQFIMSVPNDLIYAARADGASEFRIYRSIVLPSIKPALATLGMLTFMFNWNSYLWPLIVLTEQSKRTLPIILTWYSTQHTSQYQLVMAAAVIMVVPVLIIFAITQRWVVRGITLTGIK